MANRIKKWFKRYLPSIYLRLIQLRRKLFGARTDTNHLRIPPGMTKKMFFQSLEEASVNYVVLNWYEQHPDSDAGKGIELLVGDDDAETVRNLLIEGDEGIICDMYSISGLPGSSYKNMPLFPPMLSKEILAHSQTSDRHFRVPADGHRFLSLAYRTVYHSGYRSGIPSINDPNDNVGNSGARSKSKKKRAAASEVAAATVYELAGKHLPGKECTLEGLNQYLTEKGWQPPRDMLSRSVKHNPWVFDHFFAGEDPLPDREKGLACFIIREQAALKGYVSAFLSSIEEKGFEILQVIKLEGKTKSSAKKNIRGGNWDRGTHPASGGDPVMMVIALDRQPEPVPAYLAEKYPLLDNARLYWAKTGLRNQFNDSLRNKDQHCSVLHATDNAKEAWEYIGVVVPDITPEINELIYKEHSVK